MANTDWINASNAYITFEASYLIDENNGLMDSSFQTVLIPSNYTAYATLIINDALISYGTITNVKINYTCQSSSNVNAFQSALTPKTGYRDSSGNIQWTTIRTKAMGGKNQSATTFTDDVENPTRSNHGDYRIVIGTENPIKANSPWANYSYYAIDIEYTPHTHNWVSTGRTEPTCTSAGSESFKCSICGATKTDTLAKKAHTEVTISAVAPTCTATGLTEGKKCSVCGTIITAQQTVAALGHSWNATTYTWSADGKSCTAQRVCSRDSNHKETATATITSAVKTAATCTAKGTTTYTAKFSVSWATTQTKDVQDIPAKGHTEVVIPAVPATCTATGLTEGKKCSVCNTILVAQQTVPAKGHTEVIDKAVAPTCTTTGKTEGKHCSVCNVVIVAQQTIPTIDHSYTSSTSGGYIVYICDHCGHSYSERALIPIKANLEQVTGVYIVPDANDPETGTIVYVMSGTVPTVETVFHTVDGWHFIVSNTIPDNSYPLEKLFVTDNKGNTTRIW